MYEQREGFLTKAVDRQYQGIPYIVRGFKFNGLQFIPRPKSTQLCGVGPWNLELFPHVFYEPLRKHDGTACAYFCFACFFFIWDFLVNSDLRRPILMWVRFFIRFDFDPFFLYVHVRFGPINRRNQSIRVSESLREVPSSKFRFSRGVGRAFALVVQPD